MINFINRTVVHTVQKKFTTPFPCRIQKYPNDFQTAPISDNQIMTSYAYFRYFYI